MADVEVKAKKCSYKFKKSRKGCKQPAVENSKFCANHTPTEDNQQANVHHETDMDQSQLIESTMSDVQEQTTNTDEKRADDIQLEPTTESITSEPQAAEEQDDAQRLAEMFANIKQQMAQQDADITQQQDGQEVDEIEEGDVEEDNQQTFPFFVVTPEMMANPSFAATFGPAFGYSEEQSEPRIVELVESDNDEAVGNSPPVDHEDEVSCTGFEEPIRGFQFQPVFRTTNEKAPKPSKKAKKSTDNVVHDEPMFTKSAPKQKKSKRADEEIVDVHSTGTKTVYQRVPSTPVVTARKQRESPQRKTPEEPSRSTNAARKVTFHPSDDVDDKFTPAWTKLTPPKNKNKRNRKPAQHDIGTRSDSILDDMDRDKVYARCSISDYIAIELNRHIAGCPDYQDVLSVLGSPDGLLVMNKFATSQWAALKEYNGRWFHLGASASNPSGVISLKVASKALLQLKKRVNFWDEAAKHLSQSWHPRQHQFYCFAVSYKEHHFSVAPYLTNPKSFDPNVTRLDRYLIAFTQPKDAVRLANSLDEHYKPELIVLRVSEESPFLPISNLQIALVPGTPLIWCDAPDPLARKIFASESPVVAPHVRLAYVEL